MYVCFWCGYVNSALNPWLYNVSNRKIPHGPTWDIPRYIFIQPLAPGRLEPSPPRGTPRSGILACEQALSGENKLRASSLHQLAFCVEIFDADIQIPEMSLQALSPSSLLSRPHPRQSLLARITARKEQVYWKNSRKKPPYKKSRMACMLRQRRV